MKTKAHQRYKTKDGAIVPGATTIIKNNLGWNKQALLGWMRREALRGNDPYKMRDKAADIGTIAHYLCECDAKGIKPDLSEYAPADVEVAENCFLGYLDWKKQHNAKIVKTELQLVSEKYKFGGTIDTICTINGGELVLGDIKTSSGIYPTHKIQVAAYYNLALETGYDLKEAFLLHFDKKGNFAVHKIRELDYYWEIFKDCLSLEKKRR